MMNFVRYAIWLVAVMMIVGCGKTSDSDQADTSSASGGTTEGAAAAQPGTDPSFTVDGRLDGRLDEGLGEPIVAEAGEIGRGPFDGVDIKEVVVANDEAFLYIYMGTAPSVAQQYRETESTGLLCDVYVDVDNDASTGCEDFELVGYGPISGFERKIHVPQTVFASTRGNGYELVCTVQTPDGRGQWAGPSPFSDEAKAQPIADSTVGVEMCIPLAKLDLKPGDTVRILMQENANCFEPEGCNEFVYTITGP